jgi:hypothetical protein
MLNDPEESKILIKYGSLYAIIFSIIIILYYAAFDTKALSTNTFTYAMSIIIPLIIILSIVIPFSRNQTIGISTFIMTIVAIFFAAIFYFYSKANQATYKFMNYIVILLMLLMVFSSLSIIFYILSNYLKSLSGWSGFIVYFIFYIPCLFIDFIKYIMNEFKMTTNPIFVLLIIELLIILLYVYLPWILHSVNISKNVTLLPGSAFLDIQQTIGNSDMNKIPKFIRSQNDLETFPVYKQNYAFSMWIFINPQAPNYVGYSSESTIFNYNGTESGGKPKVTYFNDMKPNDNNFGKTSVDKYCVYFTNSQSPVGRYKFSMPSQKWNNLVMNFTSTQADLFVNGNLEYTYIYEGNIPTFLPTDFIKIGQEKGLDGAICNVTYYPTNLSLIEIANNYNMLHMRNPPTSIIN